jgi:hypothetical protein
MAEIDKKVIQDRIDKLNSEIREGEIVKNNHLDLANRIQIQITSKLGAINELTELIKDEKKPQKKGVKNKKTTNKKKKRS